MDYIKIILDGYLNTDSRNFLPHYFVREQKKAEKDYFSYEEFFAGCRQSIKQLLGNLESQLQRQRKDDIIVISALKSGAMKVNYSDSSITYNEQVKKTILEWQQQLDSWSIKNFSVNINDYCKNYTGHLLHDDLLFIDNAIKIAENNISKLNKNKSIDYNTDFIKSILHGIKELQNQDINAECIRLVKMDKVTHEAKFRDWFKTYLSDKYASVNAEPEKGNGRIDLKIEDNKINTKIIEFKGWWNTDKKQVISQILNYLTDFESEGFIIIINDKKKNVEKEYIEIIKSDTGKYMLTKPQVQKTESGYKYYISYHYDKMRTKTLYHFIINVY
ncbi:MAG: hypothetical protein WCS51_04990 [Bacilli bacterium]